MSGGRRAPHPWSWGLLSCRPFPLSPVIAGCRSVGTRWGQAGAVPSGRPLSALMSLAPLMSPQALPLRWALCCLSRDSVSTHEGLGWLGVDWAGTAGRCVLGGQGSGMGVINQVREQVGELEPRTRI